MEDTITPYELPEVADHSFFFVDASLAPELETGLHRHDAWELFFVTHGSGSRTCGETTQAFGPGEAVLIPPSMVHRWAFDPASADSQGNIHYLMVAFANSFVERCRAFPEVDNRLARLTFPVDALRFGAGTARALGAWLARMRKYDELGRLCEMVRLLPQLFAATEHSLAGRATSERLDRDVVRMQRVSTYVMRHYRQTIALDDIAAEVGMHRTAFCSWFKRHKGMTFSQYVTDYRLKTACELLQSSARQVSEVCYLVGFNDLPHFVRVFGRHMGVSPSRYRKEHGTEHRTEDRPEELPDADVAAEGQDRR